MQIIAYLAIGMFCACLAAVVSVAVIGEPWMAFKHYMLGGWAGFAVAVVFGAVAQRRKRPSE